METLVEVEDYVSTNIFVENFKKRYIEKGFKKGFKKGFEKGREEIIKTIVERAITQGILNLSDIAEMLDVTIDYVLDIKNKIDKNKNYEN